MDKHYHHQHIGRYLRLRHMLHDRYNDLVLADSFRHLSLSLISLFVPIFMLEVGYSLIEVAVLELSMFLAIIIFHYIFLELIPRWGVKLSLIISYLLNVVFYLLLYNAVSFMGTVGKPGFLFIVALFNVVPTVLYWSAHHIYFFRSTDNEHAGSKAGLLFCIPSIVGIVSPYLGAVLINEQGFKFVFLVSALLLIAASLSLSFSDNFKVPSEKMNIRSVIDRKHMRKNLIYFVQGINVSATSFLWPIFLFISSVKITSIGALYLISSLVYSMVAFAAGKRTDKKSSRKVVAISSIGHGTTIIMRPLMDTLLGITAWQTAGGFFGGLLHVTLESEFYKHTTNNYISGIMNREFYMYIGRLLTVSFFVLLLVYLPDKPAFVYALIFAGLITFSLSFIARSIRVK